jgi:hypothetical protein
VASPCYAIHVGLIKQGTFETKVGAGQPRLAAGNDLIAFVRKHREVSFLGTSKVERTKIAGSDEAPIRLEGVSEVSSFSEPRTLAVLAGSLKKVYRFLEPERHFQRPIVALSVDDFETITTGQVDLFRTVFRYLFSALPFEVQAEFTKMHAASIPSRSEGRVWEYPDLAKAIVSFFGERVRGTMRLLAQLATVHQDIKISDLPAFRTLHLESNAEVISLGETATAAQRELEHNVLFASRGEGQPLLHEATKQLDVNEDRELWRRWDETLF